jgi:hypothetical protein
MSKLVEFQDVDGNEFYVNPEHVVVVQVQNGEPNRLNVEITLTHDVSITMVVDDDGYGRLRALVNVGD